MNNKWKKELLFFFDLRSSEVKDRNVSFKELCYISGRDPRIWMNRQVYDDLIESIKKQLELNLNHILLEVGCAAGFLAIGLSRTVKKYIGVDISNNAIKVASKLKIKNAVFKRVSENHLPFPNNYFDRVISYDVFTNFPSMDYVEQVIKEMVRVTKFGGKIMIGSLADKKLEKEYIKLVQEVNKRLDSEKGKLIFPCYKNNLIHKIKLFVYNKFFKLKPQIVCYYFDKTNFIELGKKLGLEVKIFDIHKLNPYYGYRFNVVYTK